MDIGETIRTNLRIMELILSKYGDQETLSNATGLEARYYASLKKDADKARSALGSGGIATKIDKESLL